MPKLREVTGGTQNKDLSSSHMLKCVLAVTLTIEVGVTNVGSQGKALKDSAKIILAI
jgi:hypothetical protein